MKLPVFLFATIVIGLAAPSLAQPYQPAMTDLVISDKFQARQLAGLMWYPSAANGPLSNDFQSKVWAGNKVIKDGVATVRSFPLVVLSHGMFGNARNQAWLAAGLAKRGFVVAAINHPGTSTWLRDPAQRRQLWKRSKDISRVIDYFTTSSEFTGRIDPDRIYVAGHSLGGFTSVSLAGGRYDAARLERFCADNLDELVCGILDEWNIAKIPEERALMEADHSDRRITAFAVFDLGGTQSFIKLSLGQIVRPMLVFGAPVMNSGLTLDIESRALLKALPSKTARYIEPATLSHFDFLGRCKPGGYELLAKEEPGDEIICAGGGSQRAKKHQMIIDEVAAFFSRH